MLRTAKPCGPGTRCWCQVGGGVASPTGFGKTFNPPMTVTRRIRRRGERGISRENHCAGKAGCSGEPVVDYRVLSTLCTRGGAAGTRLSLLPSWGSTAPLYSGRTFAKPGRTAPRDRGFVSMFHRARFPDRRFAFVPGKIDFRPASGARPAFSNPAPRGGCGAAAGRLHQICAAGHVPSKCPAPPPGPVTIWP
jgi:hypothetical protein